ncbi:pro-FMRFamide-related neuropeptide VF [Dermochelys coriacea]|uniref:pro-FMRFamide-related neuropeptide VF n=1 Tax=Dermochelys coriacea TaxID=27794 RepID=UPI0018E6F3C9|nr:pro-FMRFamide-related neuropeptide VF [Dermochelys coriacea]
MKIISIKRFILFTLTIFIFLTSNTLCLDESAMSSLRKSDYGDKYSESSEDFLEEKQRSLNFEEVKDWRSKNIIKMSTPTVNKMPNSLANLPLRFGRNVQEKRSIKPVANLPLRFGRAFEGSISRYAPNLLHRFRRFPFVKSSIQSLANLPQRFGKSLPSHLSQDIQESEQGNNRNLYSNNYIVKESNDEDSNQKSWDLYLNQKMM